MIIPHPLHALMELRRGGARAFPQQLLVLCMCLMLASCANGNFLADSPTLYTLTGSYPDEDLPTALRTPEAELFYVTDRVRDPESLAYTADRSASMAFGSVHVEYGEDSDWSSLSTASSVADREQKIDVNIGPTKELVRFPETPIPFELVNGRATPLPGPAAADKAAKAQFAQYVRESLRQTSRKEIVLFVHGFNNTFEDGAYSLADVWHFTGRVGVPILYSWPAGNGGVTGYFRDREAGEFTIYHLKQMIRTLSAIKEVEGIHILAHSRGTDVATTSLRELVIETRSGGRDPRQALKVKNLILAAPDLDFGVVRQRLIAERFGPAIEQITVYMNKGDSALNFSQKLMSGQRFGRLTVDDLGDSERAIFSKIRNVNFVDIEGESDFFGHGYFRKNPGVLSDIVIAIRDQARPGDPQRPLVHLGANFWNLPEGYPASP